MSARQWGIVLAAIGGALAFAAEAKPAEPLPSWNEGPAKRAIVDFVAKVTREGSPQFVPAAERIATFDNDGTLWAEQPIYFQFAFAIDRIKALAPASSRMEGQGALQVAHRRRSQGARLAGGEHAVLEAIATTHSNLTTEEFDRVVSDWLATAKHPKTGQPYTEMAYRPMLEVLDYLRTNGFKTFIVSGGGIDFMRAFAEKVYGIPPEQVIGTTGKLRFEMRDGKPVLFKLPGVEFVDDKEGKPMAIQRNIGRRPIAAFGNSDGDLQMLQWTAAGDGARLCVFVRHTDAQREWAYDRQSSIGRLDKGLDEAGAKGWTVVDMAKEWKVIYAFEKR